MLWSVINNVIMSGAAVVVVAPHKLDSAAAAAATNIQLQFSQVAPQKIWRDRLATRARNPIQKCGSRCGARCEGAKFFVRRRDGLPLGRPLDWQFEGVLLLIKHFFYHLLRVMACAFREFMALGYFRFVWCFFAWRVLSPHLPACRWKVVGLFLQ